MNGFIGFEGRYQENKRKMKNPEKIEYNEDDVSLARFAKALGHPARIAIIRHLASLNTCCFNEVSDILPIADSTVSQHMSELKDAGLICGEYDPPRVNYCINRKEWKTLSRMMEDFMNIKVVKH
jgi:ArsR family transcriptional regulator, arsenate/arsenite/antimonite-responsive transcriptional repressor